MALTEFSTRATFTKHPRAPRPSILTMLAVWRSRHALAQLDPRALDDIGVTASRAAAEATKPIWNVPTNWRA